MGISGPPTPGPASVSPAGRLAWWLSAMVVALLAVGMMARALCGMRVVEPGELPAVIVLAMPFALFTIAVMDPARDPRRRRHEDETNEAPTE